MTIELSLRHRAAQARIRSMVLLGLAVFLLVGTYVSLPLIAGRTLDSIAKIQNDNGAYLQAEGAHEITRGTNSFFSPAALALITMFLGVSAVGFAGYLLGRGAFMELELARRYSGIADALCIAGDSIENLEQAVTLLVPKGQFFSDQELVSKDDLKSLAEIVGKLHGTGIAPEPK